MRQRLAKQGGGKARPSRDRRIGLARIISKSGYCSRSKAAELIRTGRVQLNGAVRRDPETPVRERSDKIQIGGIPLAASHKVYLIVNKPRGLITTAADEKGRQTVYSCLPHGLPWVSPVGRLDKASEGLLLMTNDSDWSARIQSPGSHLSKTYHVQVAARVNDDFTQQLVRGIHDASGDFLRARQARVFSEGAKNTWLEVVLDEGKNRQIRRMVEHLGGEVLRLVRVSIGPLQLGDLAKGQYRALTREEKLSIDCAMEASRGAEK